jgi:hypothetical protein
LSLIAAAYLAIPFSRLLLTICAMGFMRPCPPFDPPNRLFTGPAPPAALHWQI